MQYENIFLTRTFSATVRGEYHKLSDIPCQDASASYHNDAYAVAIVADGHGAPQHYRSEQGAEFAVTATEEVFRDLIYSTNRLKNLPNDSEWQKQVARDIITHWVKMIEHDVQQHPFDIEEDSITQPYGSTLVAVIRTEDKMLCLQIGDGAIAAFRLNGQDVYVAERIKPIETEDMMSESITHSLCEHDAIDHFRFVFFEGDDVPDYVYVMTDGVYNHFHDCQGVRNEEEVDANGELIIVPSEYHRTKDNCMFDFIELMSDMIPEFITQFIEYRWTEELNRITRDTGDDCSIAGIGLLNPAYERAKILERKAERQFIRNRMMNIPQVYLDYDNLEYVEKYVYAQKNFNRQSVMFTTPNGTKEIVMPTMEVSVVPICSECSLAASHIQIPIEKEQYARLLMIMVAYPDVTYSTLCRYDYPLWYAVHDRILDAYEHRGTSLNGESFTVNLTEAIGDLRIILELNKDEDKSALGIEDMSNLEHQLQYDRLMRQAVLLRYKMEDTKDTPQFLILQKEQKTILGMMEDIRKVMLRRNTGEPHETAYQEAIMTDDEVTQEED